MKDQRWARSAGKSPAEAGTFAFAPNDLTGEVYARAARTFDPGTLTLEVASEKGGYDPYDNQRRLTGSINWYTPRR
jgi:hypothetical protein